MNSNEIRSRFLRFFEKRGHAVIPSASLIPKDRRVLFNTAGMQPLIPYLLGESHPKGKRLVNSQKCVRTQDIDEVGDNTHDTFFEMLGNWSLGDYWKREAIEWSYEFLTSTTEGLGLNPKRLYITCFEGNKNAPRDEECQIIWKEIFDKNKIRGERIYFRGANKNWWQIGDNGPCGPDTEMFYDLTGTLTKGMDKEEYIKVDKEQKVVEIWNDVFMQYMQKNGKVIAELPKRNVDTGAGLERVAMAVQAKTNIFDTDLFEPAITHIRSSSKKENVVSERIVADHIRTTCFIIADGVIPSNTDRGYVLRRLIRRAVRHADILGLNHLSALVDIFTKIYNETYPYLTLKTNLIKEEIEKEENKFRTTLTAGLKQFEKIADKNISGEQAFTLFSTYGFPFELTKELAKEKGLKINKSDFKKELKNHQEKSRVGAQKRFAK